MADIVRVLDTRIGARFREPRPSDIIVGSTTPLSQVIARILAMTGGDRLRSLSICCHGYEAGIQDERSAMSRMGGGFGLQLGETDLTFASVAAFSALNGRFAEGGLFDIYACAAAEDSSDGLGFTGNGRMLMRELAGQANTTVRASDAVQQYSHGVETFFGFSWYQGVDFGDWEGVVWMFLPDGTRRRDTNPGRGVH